MYSVATSLVAFDYIIIVFFSLFFLSLKFSIAFATGKKHAIVATWNAKCIAQILRPHEMEFNAFKIHIFVVRHQLVQVVRIEGDQIDRNKNRKFLPFLATNHETSERILTFTLLQPLGTSIFRRKTKATTELQFLLKFRITTIELHQIIVISVYDISCETFSSFLSVH